MEEGEIEETQQQQEPLFKPLCDSCQLEGAKAPNPKYEDGKVLPKKLRSRFLQEAKPCVPLEEIDPYFRNKQTFIVIGRWGTIHRFSCTNEGYFTLSPNNAFRRFAIYLQTNWIFSTLILATLLLNIVALLKTQNYEIMAGIGIAKRRSWVVDAMYIVNYICLAIYCFELAVKVVARGLIGDSYTCFRDPWTWLDVLVIWTGFCPYQSFILQRRATVWFRLFKIIPLVPSIRQACRLSWKAVKKLGGMLTLLVITLWFFALLGTQIYMGTLTQKCVKNIPDRVVVTDEVWARYTMNTSNWYKDDYDFAICGNATGARPCPDGYVCLQGLGSNPDFGYTNFDNVLWSLLSVIRIGSEDFTEEIFRQILSANGPWQIIFFELIFFLITFPMGCLFFAILGHFFTESKAPSELELEEITGLAELHDFDNGQNPESLVTKGKNVDSQEEEELVGFRKALHGFIFHDWIKNILICVILIDILGIASDHYGIEENRFAYHLYILAIPYIVFLLYTLEFLLKIIALGPAKYFRNRWNHLDLIVLLTFFLEIQSYVGQYTGYMLAPIRLLKLVQYWPSLRMIFGIYYKTIKALWGWVLYTVIMFAFVVFIGPFELGQFEAERFRGKDKMTDNDLPRWSFVDFWHSFRMVWRMQIAEWVETFWDIFPYAGIRTVIYYLVANLTGALLISFIFIGVVYTTIGELQNSYDPNKERGLRLLLKRAVGIVYFPISRIQPRELIMKNGSDPLAATENGADESETKKPEGKGEGGRRKKSIVAESTGQLRKVMQDCTEHWAYKIACTGVIIVASLAMIFETKDASDDLQIALFVIEIVFTVAFFIVAVYELLSYGFKEAIMDRGWLFDALIVFENILNLTVYQFSVTGSFRVGVFCIRSFRPLMLIARVDWLKAPFRGIKSEMKTVWETILAIFFIWLFFDTFGVHWLAGLYYKCLDFNGHEVRPTLTKIECLARNLTWRNSEYHFDNSGDGFINMLFLVSRMGWVSIINDGSDAVGQGIPRQRDSSKFWLIYFIVFVFCGGLGALGILFSYVFNRFREDKGYDSILTENQAKTYTEAKTSREPRQTWVTLEDEYIPAPDAPCMLSFYNVVTNQKFDAGVMLLIILDNVILSLDHFGQDQKYEVCLVYFRLAILLLFIAEMIIKLIAWGKHYFRNGWNYLDMFVILTGIIELILADVMSKYFVSTSLIRMLRLLRIFRFLLAKNCGSTTVKVLFSAVTNVRHAFGNLLLLQLTIMWAFALLGTYLFENVQENYALSHDINFKTFRNSFWVLALLLGFPCLDGLYSALSNEEDCQVVNPEMTTCGDKTSAILYIGLYAGLTFLVLLNMYAVLISEIIVEIGRFNKDSPATGDEEVPLQDVTTDNGQNGGNGELSDAGEEPEGEDEAGSE